ncbi:hypothetical protein BpHYR1_043591, partial [Brachionus plicatilis]
PLQEDSDPNLLDPGSLYYIFTFTNSFNSSFLCCKFSRQYLIDSQIPFSLFLNSFPLNSFSIVVMRNKWQIEVHDQIK